MNQKIQKVITALIGGITAIAILVRMDTESDAEYWNRELKAVEAALKEVNSKWTTERMSLHDAAKLQRAEEALLRRKEEAQKKLGL